MSTKVAVVTGSNKGIGFAIVKGLCKRYDGVVFLTSRNEKRGKEAVKKLEELGLRPKYHQLDVTDRVSVKDFCDHIKSEYGVIDILINNAAVAELIDDSYEKSKMTIDINYKSLFIIQDLLFPLIRTDGRVVNMSSDCGHLSNVRNDYWAQRLSRYSLTKDDVNEFVEWFLKEKKNNTFESKHLADGGTIAAYRVSKIAISAITVVQQRDLVARNISVNSVHPGYVRTDLTWGMGWCDIDEAAKTPIYLALDAPQDLKGAYVWHDGKVVDWFNYKEDIYFKRSELIGTANILLKIYIFFSMFMFNCKQFFKR